MADNEHEHRHEHEEGHEQDAASAPEAPAAESAESPESTVSHESHESHESRESHESPVSSVSPVSPVSPVSIDELLRADDLTERAVGDGTEPVAPLADAPLTPEEAAHLRAVFEAILFVADRPVTLRQLREVAARDLSSAQIKAVLDEAEAWLAGHGFELAEVAGGYQLRSSSRVAAEVARFLQVKPRRLSRPALETLAVVAYRQPVTRAEVESIRGVDSGAVLKALLDRRLVRILGKKEEPGRPLLYGTTREFLEFFNLRDLRQLPTLREFHELTEEERARVDRLAEDGAVDAASPAALAEAAGVAGAAAAAAEGTEE
jgi:segregation and condensation protein B